MVAEYVGQFQPSNWGNERGLSGEDPALEATARRVIEALLPNESGRLACLRILADYIRKANAVNDKSWSITLFGDVVRLNVGPAYAVSIHPNGIACAFLPESMDADALVECQRYGGVSTKNEVVNYVAPNIWVPVENAEDLEGTITQLSTELVERHARIDSRTRFYRHHAPGVVEFLKATVAIDLPSPNYPTPGPRRTPQPMDTLLRLQERLASSGLDYSSWQVATFATALQAKGFVILSGISGTGKTKLVQHFSSMLPMPRPAPVVTETQMAVTVQPYMRTYARFIVPKRILEIVEPSLPAESADVTIFFDGRTQPCLLYHYPDSMTVRAVLLRGEVRRWFVDRFKDGDRFVLEPVIGGDQEFEGFRVIPEVEWSSGDQSESVIELSNHLFLSVRPDWRDSKALLGYYNPLTEAYEWTPFLRFLERARRSFEQGDGLAWFVVLDEMNLAHVEYYFADLLSVMESGRDEQGWTNEELLLVYPETADGDLPPREMRLPPNLYVVGTVNIDETTHAFSPKVLDRAFSIELVDVDFSDYPPTPTEGPELSDAERQTLLAAFTRNGRFPRIDKAEIAAYVARHREARDRLQALNARLRRDNLHFGYRVFDEIVTFLAVADENGMFDDLGDNAAFDAAVLMKVLPKFHGSRGKLQRPLEALLAWCLSPDELNPILPLPQPGGEVDPLASYRTLPYALPKTAERVLRMLDELQTDGFTAFG